MTTEAENLAEDIAAAEVTVDCEPHHSEPAAASEPMPRLRLPTRDSMPPLQPRTDYEMLRVRRLAEVDEELRHVNLPFDRRDHGVSRDPNILAEGIVAHNFEIPGPAGPMGMRIFMPERPAGPVGVYVHTHGGGWAGLKGLDGFDTENSGYARDWGCAVVHPDFRVSWDAKFPAAVDDCFAAYRYVVDHADELGIDATRIGIGGGCTGANIATVVALMARDAAIQKPAIQWLWSGAFDTRNVNQSFDEFANYSLPAELTEAATRLYLSCREDAYDWRASPILAETLRGASPALVWTGGWEIIRDDSRQYVNRMRDAGVDVTYIEGPRQPHGGIYATNPITGDLTAYAKATVPTINEIMRGYIGPR